MGLANPMVGYERLVVVDYCSLSVVTNLWTLCAYQCDGRLAATAVPNILQLPRLRVARLSLRSTDLSRKHWQLPTAVPPDHRRRQESGHTLRSLHSTSAVDERTLNVNRLHE